MGLLEKDLVHLMAVFSGYGHFVFDCVLCQRSEILSRRFHSFSFYFNLAYKADGPNLKKKKVLNEWEIYSNKNNASQVLKKSLF